MGWKKASVESHLKGLLKTMKGYKFVETLEVTFVKVAINSKTGEREDIYKTAFFNSKAQTITKGSEIEPELSMSRQEILRDWSLSMAGVGVEENTVRV